jgi:hypothetical protein
MCSLVHGITEHPVYGCVFNIRMLLYKTRNFNALCVKNICILIFHQIDNISVNVKRYRYILVSFI